MIMGNGGFGDAMVAFLCMEERSNKVVKLKKRGRNNERE